MEGIQSLAILPPPPHIYRRVFLVGRHLRVVILKGCMEGHWQDPVGLSKAIRRLKEGLKSEFEAYTCVDEAFPGENETSPGKRNVLR